MARIRVDIPKNKRGVIALPISLISKSRAVEILEKASS
jgi:ribosomal protein S13